jgi:hypothetical protein
MALTLVQLSIGGVCAFVIVAVVWWFVFGDDPMGYTYAMPSDARVILRSTHNGDVYGNQMGDSREAMEACNNEPLCQSIGFHVSPTPIFYPVERLADDDQPTMFRVYGNLWNIFSTPGVRHDRVGDTSQRVYNKWWGWRWTVR